MKARLAECHASSNLSRSDSMDSILGDSLIDPPQSLQKIPPKRYQSPSRCGSPSLEAPDHLLFGKQWDKPGNFVFFFFRNDSCVISKANRNMRLTTSWNYHSFLYIPLLNVDFEFQN